MREVLEKGCELEVILWGEKHHDWEICKDHQEALQFIEDQHALGVEMEQIKMIHTEDKLIMTYHAMMEIPKNAQRSCCKACRSYTSSTTISNHLT